MEGMIGEVRLFAGNFAPKNWALCSGQIINIASNTALFSILGTTYGGNGTTTFMLPDLQGRTAIGAGNGPGLSARPLGAKGGGDTVTLVVSEIPAHTHGALGTLVPACNGGPGDDSSPGGNFVAEAASDLYTSTANVTMGPSAVTISLLPVGGNGPHENQQPYLGMNYVICMYGIFPSRN
jgi:microcystin-dependent protein